MVTIYTKIILFNSLIISIIMIAVLFFKIFKFCKNRPRSKPLPITTHPNRTKLSHIIDEDHTNIKIHLGASENSQNFNLHRQTEVSRPSSIVKRFRMRNK
mmetsp:Transcript_12282/g.10887  ORF Transcript_12282/g.10887 Transcript_12282/m.10887 type:complete len:100 (+) Transcript_12282:80-379(+)